MSMHRESIRYEYGTDEWDVHPDSQSAPIFKMLSPGWYLYLTKEIEDYERCPIDGLYPSFAAAQAGRSRRRGGLY